MASFKFALVGIHGQHRFLWLRKRPYQETFGSRAIHFDGKETISFDSDVLTWGGQQEESGNGDYLLEYAENYQSFVAKKTGYEPRFYIRYYSKDLLVIQENNASGALRYWFTSPEKAVASDISSLPEIVIDDDEIPDPAHSVMDDINDILAIRQGISDSEIRQRRICTACMDKTCC